MRAVFLFTFVSLGLATTLLAEELAHSIFAGSGESTINDQPYQAGEPDGDRTRMPLGNPFGIEIAGDSIWITSVDDHCIYRGTINGNKLRRVAGTGQSGYSGDGTVATKATFNWPHEVRADQVGNLYVADTRNHVIRRIDASDIVSTVAGTGKAGYAGDGKSGNQVQFKQPHSVILDGEGGLLVADTGNHRLRRIDLQSGIVETISGTGAKQLPIDGANHYDPFIRFWGRKDFTRHPRFPNGVECHPC